MAKQIYSCEVMDYLKEGKEVFYIDYEGFSIVSLINTSVFDVQELINKVDLNNDSKTYFYIMEDKND